jgi:hypothetical protein
MICRLRVWSSLIWLVGPTLLVGSGSVGTANTPFENLASDSGGGAFSSKNASYFAIRKSSTVLNASLSLADLEVQQNIFPLFALPQQSIAVQPRDNRNNNGKIEIKPIESGQGITDFDLKPFDASKLLLVNMIPRTSSGETGQDSEPFLAVRPDQKLMVGAAYFFRHERENEGDTSPLFLSTDNGFSWALTPIVPFYRIGSQTYCFSGTGSKLYGSVMGRSSGVEPVFGAVSVIETGDPIVNERMQVISTLSSGPQFADEPFIQARAFKEDRIYVGQNYFGSELGNGKTASVRVSADGGETFRLLGVEARTTAGQDAPSVRPSIAEDGTLYVAFMRWTKMEGFSTPGTPQATGDVVVTRDDEGAIGQTPFLSLIDPADGKPGRIVAQNRVFPFSMDPQLGQQRIGSNLSLAVHPNNSRVVYIAWADLDPSTNAYTIHLRKSIDRGQNWSKDLLTIPSATNPAIAVAHDGAVGFLYQQLAEAGKPQERWETHFQKSEDATTGWIDLTLAAFPTDKEPEAQYQPYLGDKIHLLSVADDFYGVFSAPNIPEQRYFPQGVRFQRLYREGRLLDLDGAADVKPSIDPYFFHYRSSAPVNLPNASWLEKDSSVVHWAMILGVIGLATSGLLVFIWFVKYRVPQDVKGTIDRVLEEKVRGPVLANYTGFVVAMFTDEQGQVIEEVNPEEHCDLSVRFVQEQPSQASAELIDLREGEDAPQVIFRISTDGGEFEVIPDRQTIAVAPKGFAEARFEVVAPCDEGNHSLFIQVFQKTRLVQVVSLTLHVRL